jgi:Prealbumin-like fold domain/von Willebrand factor type A domain
VNRNAFPGGSLPLPQVLIILTMIATTVLALQAAPGPRTAYAATATLHPISDGTYTAWTNGFAAVNETSSYTCDNAAANSVISASAGDRESFNLDLSSIPNGSVIEGIEVTVRHRGTFNQGTGGTYQTFVRIGSTNVAAGSTKTATTDSGSCQGPFSDTYDIADFPKTASSSIEIGVIKGNSTSVNVGAISAVITYTSPVDNPDGFDTCGANVVLIMDSSESVSDSQMDDMKAALKNFAQPFLDNTNSDIAVVEFDNEATVHQGLTNDYSLIETAIDQASTTSAIGGDTEWTNWQAALQAAQAALEAGDPGKDNIAILISDGEPTQSSGGSPTTAQPNVHYLPALNQANTMKGLGSYIMTLGVSPADSDSVARLNGVSSPSDTHTPASFDLLDEQLATIFADAQACFGELALVKEIVNDDGGTRVAADWTLTATSDENTYSSEDAYDEIIDDETAIYFLKVAPGTYEVSESGPGGYTASDWHCEVISQLEGDSIDENDPSVITLAAGGRIVCDIVNDDSPGLICVDGDYVPTGDDQVATNDCDPIRICVDGESMTVTEFKYHALLANNDLDVSRGSCSPEEPPPTQVPPTQIPPTPAIQEVQGIVATPTPATVVESITPPSTGDGGLSRNNSTSLYVAVAGVLGLLSVAALILRRKDGESAGSQRR